MEKLYRFRQSISALRSRGSLSARGEPLLRALLVLVLLSGCAGTSALPASRGLITLSGARLPPDPDRMDAIDIWIRAQMENIQEDPSFLIDTPFLEEPNMPWEGFSIEGDTAWVRLQGTIAETRPAFLVYAHLHLMHRVERLDEWLPDALDLAGYELERAIVARTIDVWFYGRSVYGWPPYSPMDELLFSSENGYLDAYLLTARAEEFAEEREAWLDTNVGAMEDYRSWFRGAFETNPPGLR